MKRILYALVVFCAVGFLSCRKSTADITIKQFDSDQIQQYIKDNGLTGQMLPDTTGHYNGTDTTGIYYQILSPGKGDVIAYSNVVAYTYTDKTFDGKYSTTDTILNHVYTFAGYVGPNGVQLAIKNIAQRFGTKIRVLIPSRLMYGINGTTLSAYNTAGTAIYSTISGNQCFDYTINVINTQTTVAGVTTSKQPDYDDLSITKYLAANGLAGQYTKTTSGLWYRITQPGTGTDPISISSTVGVQYTGTLFDGAIFDAANIDDGTAAASFTLYDVIPAWQEGFTKVTAGAKLSLICPSRLAYGSNANTQGAFPIPGFSCLRFDINVISVAN